MPGTWQTRFGWLVGTLMQNPFGFKNSDRPTDRSTQHDADEWFIYHGNTIYTSWSFCRTMIWDCQRQVSVLDRYPRDFESWTSNWHLSNGNEMAIWVFGLGRRQGMAGITGHGRAWEGRGGQGMAGITGHGRAWEGRGGQGMAGITGHGRAWEGKCAFWHL